MSDKLIRAAKELVQFAFDGDRGSALPDVTWRHVWNLHDALEDLDGELND